MDDQNLPSGGVILDASQPSAPAQSSGEPSAPENPPLPPMNSPAEAPAQASSPDFTETFVVPPVGGEANPEPLPPTPAP